MSNILEAVFETALGLYKIGLMDEDKFNEFVELCQFPKFGYMEDITLTPITYQVNQNIDENVYLIKRFHWNDTFKWYIEVNTEYYPILFSQHPDLEDGFDSVELAQKQLLEYLEYKYKENDNKGVSNEVE